MRREITIYDCEADEAALFERGAAQYGITLRLIDEPVSQGNARLSLGSRCVSVSHRTGVTANMLEALKRCGVEYVSTRSIGVNHIDMGAAKALGLCVENIVYSPDSVADYALMLMLMAARNAGHVLRRAAERDFRLEAIRGSELRDMTVGVLGTGRIGQAVIKRLHGFGCRVLQYDPSSTRAGGTSLAGLLEGSDMVTLHMPLSESTEHLLNGTRIARMRRGALIVNTGRGGLIDTAALLDALKSGHIGGAALDVVEGESGVFYYDCSGRPLQNDALAQLQALPNVVITPHTAFYTGHALRDIVENTLTNCMAYEGREKK